MIFQPCNYFQRFQEVADGTGINTEELVYTWKVEMEEEESIKGKGYPEEGGSKRREKNTVPTRNVIVSKLKKYIQELISSD